jgi:hypothetical protein
MTRAELKQLAAEADLAMAEAKGKRRAGIEGRPGAEVGPAKNRVTTFRPGAARDAAKPEAAAAAERPARERRRLARTNASTLALIRENGGFAVAKTVNLSLGGARVVSEARLPPAKTVDVILVLGEKAGPLRGDVIYSEKRDGGPPLYYSGLKFRDLTTGDVRALEDYLLQRRSKGPATA